MKFFLDTANVAAITSALQTGLLSGITTNPTLLSKEPRNPIDVIQDIAALNNFDVSVEITTTDPALAYKQAYDIAHIARNIVVKIPCYKALLPVIAQLAKEGIPLNITLVFSVTQALCMAKLGAKYVSPFIGRLEDIDSDGMKLLADIKKVYNNYQFRTQILAASIRSVKHVDTAAQLGIDIATLPMEIFEKLVDHPLTTEGIERFEKDWKNLGIKKFP